MTVRHTALRVGFGSIAILAVVAFGLLLVSGSAKANTPIVSFTATPSTTQAGGHPDVLVTFKLDNRYVQHSRSVCNCEDAKDAIVHLPPGLIGDPHATPQCTLADFAVSTCPIDSQIGIASISISGVVEDEDGLSFNTAVYNLIPPPTQAGLQGYQLFFVDKPQFEVISARTGGDFGLDIKPTSIFHGETPLRAVRQVLWGVPADSSHDALRLDPALNVNEPGSTDYLGNLCSKLTPELDSDPSYSSGVLSTDDPNTVKVPCYMNFMHLPSVSSNSPLTPFLQNPTTCDAPLSSSLDVLSYDGGTSHADSAWPQMTGCNQLSFNPSLYAQPTTDQTDTPSGINVNLQVPQQQSPSVPSPSELRAATVTLPAGFSINPNAADGKTACTDEEARFGTEEEAQCPEFAKIGSLEIDSSALPGPIPGFVYFGQPLPGNRYRIFLTANGFATHIKLAGTVTPDPQTGQLVISFENLPQSPLTEFNMHFFGSERGILATPTQCGTYAVTSTFAPWDSSLAAQTSSQFFTLHSGPGGAPCPGPSRPFNPTFKAASAGNTAGAHTPFAIDLTRADGDQTLSGLTVTTPPGFSGTLKGIPYCPESAIAGLESSAYSGLSELASPACPPASQVGDVTAGAGAGSRPLHVPGKVYLAGPYKGAPLSLVVVIPAVSGPYDLGNVVIRAAIKVDPLTAQVTATSDPLPQILDGILLRARSIRVDLNRPQFALNPTNCDPLSVDATISGDQGGRVHGSTPYQVANCAALPFGPKLTLKLTGGIKRRGHPAIHAVVASNPGEANIHSVSVTLPKGELLDNGHIGTVCTRVDFAKKACPASSKIGSVEVKTPLLDNPLSGSVYLRSSQHDLPDMALDLSGQIDFEAVGRIDSVKGRLRTSFESVPDVPFSEIALDLMGGSKGLLVNSESLCEKAKSASVTMIGQNGVPDSTKSKLQVSCGSNQRKKRKNVGRGSNSTMGSGK
jgi:hypothetical protein